MRRQLHQVIQYNDYNGAIHGSTLILAQPLLLFDIDVKFDKNAKNIHDSAFGTEMFFRDWA